MNEPDLYMSIVMPALDEEGNILAAVENALGALKDYDLRGEIIVVNDGSTDKTAGLVMEKIKNSPNDRIKFINHDKPKGIGESFWDGVSQSEGEVVTMFPGDNENDPWEVMRYVGLLEHVDMVIPFVFNKDLNIFGCLVSTKSP